MYPCTICTQYVLQKREMILMKCQVVRHNNNNKSFQISSKIPHYYYPSVAKPLTTLKVICQIIFCIMMSPLPVQCNLHADMAFHEKNNSSEQNNLKNKLAAVLAQFISNSQNFYSTVSRNFQELQMKQAINLLVMKPKHVRENFKHQLFE